MATWSSRKAAQAQRTCVNINVDQRATAGWKATKAVERLVEPYMVRIETTSSYSASDPAVTVDTGYYGTSAQAETNAQGDPLHP